MAYSLTPNRNVENFIKLIENIEYDITNGIGAYWKNTERFLDSFLHEDYPLLPWKCANPGTGQFDEGNPWGYPSNLNLGDEDDLSEGILLQPDGAPEEEGGAPANWASNYEYFFHLASEHEVITNLHKATTVPQSVHDVGSRHRHWLDVNTIREEMDYDEAPSETSVAVSKNTAAKRIEFLLQLLRMHIMLEYDAGNTGFYEDWNALGAGREACYTSDIAPAGATSDITNTLESYYLPPGDNFSDKIKFMKVSGYCKFTFTSPYRDGRQSVAVDWSQPSEPIIEGWVGTYPTSDMFDNHVYGAGWINPASRDMGQAAMGELYEEYGRFIYNDSDKNGAAPQLIHNGAVEKYHAITSVSEGGDDLLQTTPALLWEKWTCRATFESFLLYAAELIELLDVYYAAKDWGGAISAGIKPNIFGGKAYMSYPKSDSPAHSAALQELADNNAGYSFMSLSVLSSMMDEISREDLLVSDEVRKWWEDFLSSYLTPTSYDEDGVKIEEEEETPSNAPLSDDAPEDDFSLNIEVCIPETIESPDECPDECVPNPNAFVLDWTL